MTGYVLPIFALCFYYSTFPLMLSFQTRLPTTPNATILLASSPNNSQRIKKRLLYLFSFAPTCLTVVSKFVCNQNLYSQDKPKSLQVVKRSLEGRYYEKGRIRKSQPFLLEYKYKNQIPSTVVICPALLKGGQIRLLHPGRELFQE
jgi:hypothetical protein